MARANRARVALISIKENWERIVAISGIVGIGLVQILGEIWPKIKEDANVFGACVYMVGFALIFLVLDIHKATKVKLQFDSEQNFSAAMPRMIEQILVELKRRRSKDPLRVRVVGMRLTAIARFMAELAHRLKEESPLPRSLEVVLYHVDQDYLRLLSADQSNSDSIRWRSQADILQHHIAEIGHMFSIIPNASVSIRSYRSLPFFWAVEIANRTVFWGHFLWDANERNWIGPENTCYVFGRGQREILPFTDGLLNRIDALDEWSAITTSATSPAAPPANESLSGIALAPPKGNE